MATDLKCSKIPLHRPALKAQLKYYWSKILPNILGLGNQTWVHFGNVCLQDKHMFNTFRYRTLVPCALLSRPLSVYTTIHQYPSWKDVVSSTYKVSILNEKWSENKVRKKSLLDCIQNSYLSFDFSGRVVVGILSSDKVRPRPDLRPPASPQIKPRLAYLAINQYRLHAPRDLIFPNFPKIRLL